MLRDDAIRKGFLKPTKEDIERMNLTDKELNQLKMAFARNQKIQKTEPETEKELLKTLE